MISTTYVLVIRGGWIPRVHDEVLARETYPVSHTRERVPKEQYPRLTSSRYSCTRKVTHRAKSSISACSCPILGPIFLSEPCLFSSRARMGGGVWENHCHHPLCGVLGLSWLKPTFPQAPGMSRHACCPKACQWSVEFFHGRVTEFCGSPHPLWNRLQEALTAAKP